MSRNIVDVINKIKPILTEQGLDITPLDSIIASAEFSAPENAHLQWERLQEELIMLTTDHINARDKPLPEWIIKVSNIVTDKEPV